MTRIIDPTAVAREYRVALRRQVAAIADPLTIVGMLCADHGASVTYARQIRIGCEDVGIAFDLRHPQPSAIESTVDAANADPRVHGIIIYYPVFGTLRDNELRDLITPEKDIEALSSYWSLKLYRNSRYVDEQRQKKAIVPCAPLAIMKLLEAAGVMAPRDAPLAGKTVTVFNRSEVVGRPLAAMLANDGARVYSFDIDGPLLFSGGPPQETSIARAQACAEADVVITGVPSHDFQLIRAAEIKPGAVCVNFSTFRNFEDDARRKASVFVPRIGPMTVAMLLRNTLRLYDNYRTG